METLSIPLTFIMLIIALMWFIIGTHGRWWLKVMFIFAALFCAAGIQGSLQSFFGHPRSVTANEMAGKTAWLFWARVDQPYADDKGIIEMWLRPEEQLPSGVFAYVTDAPVLYQFKYNDDFAKITKEFQGMILGHMGAPIEIKFAKQEQNSGSAENKGKEKGHEHEDGRGQMRMYILPPQERTPKQEQ